MSLGFPFFSLIYRSDLYIGPPINLIHDFITPLETPFFIQPKEEDQKHMLSYYSSEMGSLDVLKRTIIFSLKELDSSLLKSFKKKALKKEEDSRVKGRSVNIDVGFMTKGHVCLGTTKEAPHRPYLGENIWLELALWFYKGEYRPFPWTYLDYQSEEVKKKLILIRKQLDVIK